MLGTQLANAFGVICFGVLLRAAFGFLFQQRQQFA
jgi:predicted outer membrane lipoprotein